VPASEIKLLALGRGRRIIQLCHVERLICMFDCTTDGGSIITWRLWASKTGARSLHRRLFQEDVFDQLAYVIGGTECEWQMGKQVLGRNVP
jgi:hypothetical protein